MSRSGHVRPAIERMRTIALLLRHRRAFSAKEICATFEVTRKTIGRDLEFMRSRLKYEIQYQPRTGTYKLLSAPAPVL